MKYLYVPWRGKYVTARKSKTKGANITKRDCVFCQQLAEKNDKKYFILARCKHNFVMLNLHPYNAGHIMVLPLRHVKSLSELDDSERSEFINLVTQSTEIIQNKLNAEGMNLGVNLGKVSGAGIPSHIHMHIIPRWQGDTNFLPIIAQTKMISMDLNKLYDELSPLFEKILIHPAPKSSSKASSRVRPATSQS